MVFGIWVVFVFKVKLSVLVLGFRRWVEVGRVEGFVSGSWMNDEEVVVGGWRKGDTCYIVVE